MYIITLAFLTLLAVRRGMAITTPTPDVSSSDIIPEYATAEVSYAEGTIASAVGATTASSVGPDIASPVGATTAFASEAITASPVGPDVASSVGLSITSSVCGGSYNSFNPFDILGESTTSDPFNLPAESTSSGAIVTATTADPNATTTCGTEPVTTPSISTATVVRTTRVPFTNSTSTVSSRTSTTPLIGTPNAAEPTGLQRGPLVALAGVAFGIALF